MPGTIQLQLVHTRTTAFFTAVPFMSGNAELFGDTSGIVTEAKLVSLQSGFGHFGFTVIISLLGLFMLFLFTFSISDREGFVKYPAGSGEE